MAVATIGAAGDFTSWAAWHATLLATLLENEEGQQLNEELSDSATILTITAHDTTLGYLKMTAAAGASYIDNAGVRTNELRYNVANGAGIRSTGGYTATLVMSGNTPRMIIERLQVYCTSKTNGAASGVDFGLGGATGSYAKDCIFEIGAGGSAAKLTSEKIISCNFFNRSAGGGLVVSNNAGQGTATKTVVGCAVVCPSNVAPGTTGISRDYATVVLIDNAIFGFTNPVGGTGGSFDNASSNNATDAASGLPGSPTPNNQHSVTYNATTPFTQASAASNLDFRLADNANALINNGVLNADAPEDSSGFTKANPPDIGAWELGGSAPAATPRLTLLGVGAGVIVIPLELLRRRKNDIRKLLAK